MITEKQVSERTGLKPVLTFDQLQAKYESLQPKLPDNPNTATLTLNSMAVQQFMGIAAENQDRERDMQLLHDRQNMIRTIASQNGFTSQDLHNTMRVLDNETPEVPHYQMDEDDDDDFPPDHPLHPRNQYGKATTRPREPDWYTTPQTPRRPPPPPPASSSVGNAEFREAPPPPTPQSPIDPMVFQHLIMQGQHLARSHEQLTAVAREQLRIAQETAHRDTQHQAMIREFTQQARNLGSELLQRTSANSNQQHANLDAHIERMTQASQRMAEAAERNATIPPSLYREHQRTQQLVQQLLQQSQTPAQTPGLDSLTGTVQHLTNLIGQGFQNLQQHQTHMAQQVADLNAHYTQEQVTQNDDNTDELLRQGATTQSQVGAATNALHRQNHEMQEQLENLRAATQYLAAGQMQQAAGLNNFVGHLGQHLLHQTAALHMQARFTSEVMQALRELKNQPATPQQIMHVLQYYNVPVTQQQLAFAYVQGQLTPQQEALLAIEDAPSGASSSAGPAAPPMEPRAPLQDMSVNGMSEQQVRQSAAPLVHMDAMGQPIGHNIVDPGFADLEMAPPKVIPARTRARMPMKYHRTWGHVAKAVMRGQLDITKGRETLRQMRQEYQRPKLPKKTKASEPEPPKTRKVKKNFVKTQVPDEDSDEEKKE